ncbi:MAG: regulator of replication initiation timing [Candidatus Binatia bacterium]|jgi:regulator of replication initiation timing
MESKALQRLEEGVHRLVDERVRARERSEQLSAALAKSRQELEKLKAENHRFKLERTEARKRLDAVIKKFDGLAPERSVGAQDES